MSSGLYVNITDYLINYLINFYLKGKKPINVALVLFPVQNLLEATTKYTDFIEANLQQFLTFLV